MGFTNPYPASRLTLDATASINSGLQGYWPLTDGGSSTTAKDISTGGNDGTDNGGVSWASSGIGTVASFDGVDDYFAFGTFSSFFPGPSITGSISGWVKWNSGRTIPIGGQATSNERLYIGVENGKWDVGFGNYPWNSNYTGTLVAAVSGEWAHVVVSISSGVAKLYVNGSETITKTADTSVSLGGQFSIGAYIGPSGINATHTDPCEIQNVRAYNRALSATEVATLYNRPWEGTNYGTLWPYSPPAPADATLSTDTAATSLMSGCQAWWLLTDGSGSTATDIVGTNNLTGSGGYGWSSQYLGTAASSDGVDGKFTGTTISSFDDITVSCWVYYDGTNNLSDFVSNRVLGGGGTQPGFVFGSNGSTSTVEFYVDDGSSGRARVSDSKTTSLPADTWIHFCGTWNRSTQNIKIYKDGVDVTSSWTSSVTNVVAAVSSSDDLTIANRPGTTARSLGGYIQNVRVWNRTLTADEITLLYERPFEGIEYGDAFHYDPPTPASLTPLTSDSINTDQVLWVPLTETDDYASGAVDISGNSYDLTKTGTVTSESSALGTVPLFDGSTGYLRRAQDLSSHTSGVGTISLWWRLDSTAPNDPGDVLFYMGDESTSNRTSVVAGRVGGSLTTASIYFLAVAPGSPQNLIGVYDNGAAWAYDDTWHHFCYVVDTASNHMYIDGFEVSQAYYPSYGSSSTGNVFLYDATNFDAIRVGTRSISGSTSNYVQGNVSNIRMWTRALSDEEVWSIYENPWLGSAYTATSAEVLYNYIFRSKRFRRLS